MKVSRYRQDRLPWDSVAGLIGNSFFGSRGFVDLWRTLSGKPVYWVAEEGEEIQAVLPGVEFGFKLIRRFHYTGKGSLISFSIFPYNLKLFPFSPIRHAATDKYVNRNEGFPTFSIHPKIQR